MADLASFIALLGLRSWLPLPAYWEVVFKAGVDMLFVAHTDAMQAAVWLVGS